MKTQIPPRRKTPKATPLMILTDWLDTIWNLLAHPGPDTFQQEAKKAPGKLVSALIWVVAAVTVVALGTTLIYRLPLDLGTIAILWFFAPIAFLFFSFSLDVMYRKVYGAKQSLYDEFLYLITALLVPFMLLSFLLSLVPVAGPYLGWLIWLYPIFLLVQIIRALTRLKPGQAVALTVLSILLGGAGGFCLPLFLLAMSGVMPGVF